MSEVSKTSKAYKRKETELEEESESEEQEVTSTKKKLKWTEKDSATQRAGVVMTAINATVEKAPVNSFVVTEKMMQSSCEIDVLLVK